MCSSDLTDGSLMAVPIKAGDTLESGTPVRLFRSDAFVNAGWDVTADGQRFLAGGAAAQAQVMAFAVVVNWRESR